MARKSTGKTTSKRKPAKAKKTLSARTRAKKSTKPAAKKKVAKRVVKSVSKRSPAKKKPPAKTATKKKVSKSLSARLKVVKKSAASSKRTKVSKPPTKAVRPRANMTPASAVERVGGILPPKNPHPGMMGDGTEEQNLNQPGMPEARITQEDVDVAFKRTETDRR